MDVKSLKDQTGSFAKAYKIIYIDGNFIKQELFENNIYFIK